MPRNCIQARILVCESINDSRFKTLMEEWKSNLDVDNLLSFKLITLNQQNKN